MKDFPDLKDAVHMKGTDETKRIRRGGKRAKRNMYKYFGEMA